MGATLSTVNVPTMALSGPSAISETLPTDRSKDVPPLANRNGVPLEKSINALPPPPSWPVTTASKMCVSENGAVNVTIS